MERYDPGGESDPAIRARRRRSRPSPLENVEVKIVGDEIVTA
jgi:hypothetical protein